MPGVVENYVKQREYQDGYHHRMYELAVDHERQMNNVPWQLDERDQRELVHAVAIKASNQVRESVGDRGSGYESVNSREFDTGQRNAIRDWSHARNHELLERIRQSEGERVRV